MFKYKLGKKMKKKLIKSISEKPVKRTAMIENRAKREGWRTIIHSPEGSKYTGWWHNNNQHGIGEYVSRKDRLYSCHFDKNLPTCYGVSALGIGSNIYEIQYRGEWKNGKYHGKGTLHFRNGSLYQGIFDSSKREGFGQMWYSNGSYYEGDWHNDLRHGEGFFVESNGNRYEGSFLNGLKHGRGVYYLLHTGQYMNGIWSLDVCICSIMADIPFRQTSSMPTEYTINEVKLEDEANQVIDIMENTFLNLNAESPGTLDFDSIVEDVKKSGITVNLNVNLSKSSTIVGSKSVMMSNHESNINNINLLKSNKNDI